MDFYVYGNGPKFLKKWFENSIFADKTLTTIGSITDEAKKYCESSDYENKTKAIDKKFRTYRNIHCFRAVYFDTFFKDVLGLEDAQIILDEPDKGWPFGAAMVNAGGNTRIE